MLFQVEENCLTVFMPGEIDHRQAEEIRTEADRLIERKHIKHVIFDFSKTEFMDSSGIGVMMGRYRKMQRLGGDVWAANVSRRMRKILTMSGVLKIIQICEEDA